VGESSGGWGRRRKLFPAKWKVVAIAAGGESPRGGEKAIDGRGKGPG